MPVSWKLILEKYTALLTFPVSQSCFYISTWKADIHHSRRFATTINDLCGFGKQQSKLICPIVTENIAKLTD